MPYRHTLPVTSSDFCSRRSQHCCQVLKCCCHSRHSKTLCDSFGSFCSFLKALLWARSAWLLFALREAWGRVNPLPFELSLCWGWEGDELNGWEPQAGTCQPRSFFHSIISPCHVALPYPATRCLMDNTSDKGKTSSMDAQENFRGCWLLPSCVLPGCSEIPALDGLWEEISPWCCEFPVFWPCSSCTLKHTLNFQHIYSHGSHWGCLHA